MKLFLDLFFFLHWNSSSYIFKRKKIIAWLILNFYFVIFIILVRRNNSVLNHFEVIAAFVLHDIEGWGRGQCTVTWKKKDNLKLNLNKDVASQSVVLTHTCFCVYYKPATNSNHIIITVEPSVPLSPHNILSAVLVSNIDLKLPAGWLKCCVLYVARRARRNLKR